MNIPKVTILRDLNKPNRNNRVYSTEVIENAIKYAPEKLWCYFTKSPYDNDLDKVAATASNFAIVDDSLICDIEILETPLGIIVKNIIEKEVELEYTISGVGTLKSNENGNIVVENDYRFSGVNIGDIT